MDARRIALASSGARPRLGRLLAARPGRARAREDPLLASRCSAREEHLRRVDVPLGDGALRVPGLELHVGHRVTGCGFVRKRRVPEVMEGAERLVDPSPAKGGAEVYAGELARIERRPLRRVAEDEVRLVAEGRLLPALRE